jgi:Domain of unknown function (DUF4157)
MSYATFAKKSETEPASKRTAPHHDSTSLRIGEPDDALEQEADRVADAIVRGRRAGREWSFTRMGGDARLRRKCACGGSAGGGECEECKKKRETLQRSSLSPRGSENEGKGEVPPIVQEALRSPGQPLDSATRAFMELRFGHDFSQVRVHNNGTASDSARAVNAVAYTVGEHVVFDSGQYAPETRAGRQLLAHELAHVVQQREPTLSESCQIEMNDQNSPLEIEAGRYATNVLADSQTIPAMSEKAHGNLLLRQAPPAPRPRIGTTFVTRFHPGVAHDHKPTGRWADVQADAAKRCATATGQLKTEFEKGTSLDPKKVAALSETIGIECACANLPPNLVAQTARNTVMLGLPLAQAHLDHYLDGSGSTIVEDLEDVLKRDAKVRNKLAGAIKRSKAGHIRIEQSDYAVRDFQFAFGAIDRLDFEVDRASGLAHVWFQDRYEWHPVGFGYTSKPGDIRRDTNCVHAAMVELKASGAKDYWMIGDVVVPLSLITGTSATPGTSGP